MKSIFQFSEVDRSKEGRSIGAIINTRYRLPILKVLHDLGINEFHSTDALFDLLQKKITLSEADQFLVQNKPIWKERVEWALTRLKEANLVDKNSEINRSWKLSQDGFSFLEKYGLSNTNDLEEIQIENATREVDSIVRKRKVVPTKIRYWAGGFGRHGDAHGRLQDFIENDYWQALDYEDDDESSTAQNARSLFEQIQVGDKFLIKGYGGSHDLIVHYVGEVLSKDQSDYRLELTKLDVPLYKGKAPKGQGAKVWFDTLLEVQRTQDINMLFNDTMGSQLQTIDSSKEDKMSLNQILYGPPGTGKTFNSINYAVAIIENKKIEDIEQESLTQRNEVKKRFDKYLDEDLVMFTTFHQSLSYEDFIEGIKPLPAENNEKLKYEVVNGLFKEFAEIASENWFAHKKGAPNNINFEDLLDQLKDEWIKNPTIKFSMKTQGKEFTITGFSKRSIYFKKASGGEQHSLSLSTLKKIYYGNVIPKNTGVGIYYPGIVDKIRSYPSLENSDKTSLNKYVIIIDEINRGNVSQIFGELITLIETDKRIGKDEALSVTLPYSTDSFSVPPNLYIIGTMNTADRSVEALDTALRRRFSFIEMLPDPEQIKKIHPTNGIIKIEGTSETIDLCQLLNVINERIEVLVDRDHTIGHSFFINVGDLDALKSVFKNKVIPLLQEYFYGDYRKMEMVIGTDFFEKTESKKVVFAVANPDYDLEKVIYKIKDLDKMNFPEAVQNLIKGTKKQ